MLCVERMEYLNIITLNARSVSDSDPVTETLHNQGTVIASPHIGGHPLLSMEETLPKPYGWGPPLYLKRGQGIFVSLVQGL